MTKKYDLGSRIFEPAFIAPIKHITILFNRKKNVINSGFSMCGGADLGIKDLNPLLLHQLNTSLFYSDEKTLNS